MAVPREASADSSALFGVASISPSVNQTLGAVFGGFQGVGGRAKGRTQEQAAARAGMSVVTARKYEHLGKLPSQVREPRTHRTRPNPFEEDWPWIAAQLEADPALQGTTLFALLVERHPGRYKAGQLRTLQRQIAVWRVRHGPEQEVIFPQVHQPGASAQSDFTDMRSLGVTIGGIPFPHLVFHLVLPYSNVEAVRICLSESFESLSEGLESCLWQLGGVPREHRTDHLSAAIRPLDVEGRAQATARYAALMAHYGLKPTANNVGEAHENGDIEQAHHRFKVAVDQALRVRGSRDFPDREAYGRFLHDLVRRRNLTREARWQEERQALCPLPAQPLALSRELRVSVTRFSTIQVLGNTYSVPSRLSRAYDSLRSAIPQQADRHYLRLLHLAASTSESEVEAALNLLLDGRTTPTYDAVRDLVRVPAKMAIPVLTTPVVDLSVYDRLLTGEVAHV